MRFDEHCQRSIDKFGKPYEEIHRWMDDFASRYSHSERYKHRKFRHHKEGVEDAREKFGDIGALVAELHIRDDSEGLLPEKKEYDILEYR